MPSFYGLVKILISRDFAFVRILKNSLSVCLHFLRSACRWWVSMWLFVSCKQEWIWSIWIKRGKKVKPFGSFGQAHPTWTCFKSLPALSGPELWARTELHLQENQLRTGINRNIHMIIVRIWVIYCFHNAWWDLVHKTDFFHCFCHMNRNKTIQKIKRDNGISCCIFSIKTEY